MDQKPSNYHGPIDRKTLIFRDHLSFIKENLNELFEAVLISSLTSGEFNRLSLDNFGWARKIVRYLPFKLDSPNTIMAMMWEFFLQKYLHNGNARIVVSLVATEFNTYKSTQCLIKALKHHRFTPISKTTCTRKSLCNATKIMQSGTCFVNCPKATVKYCQKLVH